MTNEDQILKRKESLRILIPRTKKGNPKTDRLKDLDSMIYSRKFTMQDLDFVEKEIISAVEFFKKKKDDRNGVTS